jgi:3-deoxy-7-phosphoheptulonate synthase
MLPWNPILLVGRHVYSWRVPDNPPIPTMDELHALRPLQQPTYDDAGEVAQVVARLRSLPPLVFAGECDSLRGKMASVAAGESFILQGGDCAETFDGVTAANIQGKLRTLLSMAVVLTYAAQVPIVKVGRMAGQYTKPRSAATETRGDVTLPAYRGDAVNGFPFTPEARRHDPQRLLGVYNASAATLNLVRAFVTGGFAHLRSVHHWNADFAKSSAASVQYQTLAGEIDRLRHRRRRVQHRRLLRQPRGAQPRVRARHDPDRLPDSAAVQRVRALPLDR